MFDEFLECTSEQDDLEIVTVVCNDCVMQITLGELRDWVSDSELPNNKKSP